MSSTSSMLLFLPLITFVACGKSSDHSELNATKSTKLEIKLEGEVYVNHKDIGFDIDKINKDLAAKGLDGIPAVVVIGDNPAPYHKVLSKRIEAAKIALKPQDVRFNIYDYGNIHEMKICYRGDVTDVPGLIQGLVGNFLNGDQGILALAGGSKKIIDDVAFKSRAGLKQRFGDEYKSNINEINQWFNYNTSSDMALVMSDYGANGDGTELIANSIPACK